MNTEETIKKEEGWHSLTTEDEMVDPATSKLGRLRAVLAKHPWDTDTWQQLLKEAELTRNAQVVRSAYDEFLQRFPTSARHWIAYAQFEDKSEMVEKVFERCLRLVPSLPLYRQYLVYICRSHSPVDLPPEQAKEAQGVIIQAYEFVLQHVGYDKDAGSVWRDYIKFVQQASIFSAYEEQQKLDQVRRIYQRAVHTPLVDVELIWKDYDAFENGLSKLTAKKIISDMAPGYMTARTALRDLKLLTETIDANSSWLAKPPSWTTREVQLLSSWKRLIAWELSNPLHLEDKALLNSRIKFVFNSAMLQLQFFPELWYDAARHYTAIGQQDEAIQFLQTGLQRNPTSLLLSFLMAELQEARKADFKDIQSLFDTLIAKLDEAYADTQHRFDEERSSLLAQLRDANQSADEDKDKWDGERREEERELEKEFEREVQERVESRRNKKIAQIRSAVGLSWVLYMRFARRSQVFQIIVFFWVVIYY